MYRKLSIILLLCVAMLAPSIVTAQSFFAKQRVAVWEIFDRNNDVKLANSTKTTIRAKIEEAFTNSKHYEYYSYSISEVKAALVQQGITRPTPFDIAKKIREMSVSKGAEVDYVIFSVVKVKMHSNSYDEFVVNLSSELFSTTTFKCEKMADVDMLSNPNAIPAACSELLSALLGERLYVTTTDQPSYQQPNYGSYNSSSNGSQSNYGSSNYGQSSYSRTPQDYTEQATCGLGMKMIYVEGGTFQMGATTEQGSEADSDESPVHSVTVGSFYMAECEVTQAQWQKIMGKTIYQQRDKANSSWSMYGVGDTYPMYYVNWEEANQFCQELSAMTGRRYRLPTEAEWEYAARGGNRKVGTKYSGGGVMDAVGWYDGNSGNATHPVKQKRANALGLYDMSGNVWEWCSDWYGDYSSSSQNNPTGPSSGQYRVLRGGGWCSIARGCRVSRRSSRSPSNRFNDYGFRVVCLP